MTFIQLLAGFCEMHNAERIFRMIRGEESPQTVPEVQVWISECYGTPDRNELIMYAANVLIGGHGVEAHFPDENPHPRFTYVNRGDTYDPTLIFDLETHKYSVTSWGDYWQHIVESEEE